MTRFWVSWWSKGEIKEPPFVYWGSGNIHDGRTSDEKTYCAVIDANGEGEIVLSLMYYFPDCRMRFCESRNADFAPPEDRFPGFDESRIFLERDMNGFIVHKWDWRKRNDCVI